MLHFVPNGARLAILPFQVHVATNKNAI